MADLMDLLIDQTTGDLKITNGDFGLTLDSGTSLRQRLTMRFSTWKGEWVYNQALGTPYKQRLLVAGTSREQADAEFIAQINLEDDVTAVKNVQSTFNPLTRSYVLERIEAYVDDVLIDLSLAAPQFTKYSYPVPQDSDGEEFNVCSVDQGFIDDSNNLYKFLNIDLPETGDSTWWNLWGTDTSWMIQDYADGYYSDNEFQ